MHGCVLSLNFNYVLTTIFLGPTLCTLCGSSILRVLKTHSNEVYYWFLMYFSPTYTQHINELYTKLCPILWFQTYYSNKQNDINANK